MYFCDNKIIFITMFIDIQIQWKRIYSYLDFYHIIVNNLWS